MRIKKEEKQIGSQIDTQEQKQIAAISRFVS